MLSDEEREALRNFKSEYETCNHNSSDLIIELNDANIILNLIEKQSKEIEELKEKDDANLAYYDQIYQNGIYTGQKAVEEKIKAKIEEINEEMLNEENSLELFYRKKYCKEVLQSLLEKEGE